MAITAQAIVDRIRQKLGSGWKDPSVDTFLSGNKDSEVKGIVTTYAPSMEVLRKTVAAGKNMIISRESPFWERGVAPGAGRGPGAPGGPGRGPSIESDAVYRAKREYIAANNLVVYRFFDNWNARQPDGQLQGLAKALGWEKNYKPSGGQPWATLNGFFTIPPATLKETAEGIRTKLKVKGMRLAGDPETRVSKAALFPGLYLLADIRKLVSEPGVDLVIVGEPRWENEVSQYFFDIVASGQKKGMIVLGQAVSEDPGSGEVAAWLKSFVSEVPIEWIPTGEPC
jgi:putative NIF3 family GTP cyclohydrolase 1 type 2